LKHFHRVIFRAKKQQKFKSRLEKGESLTDLLPEAFAAVREASKRVMKMRHFDVQLIGGIVLSSRGIAEMKTGEGKTLVATLPVYLHALEGKGVHVVTVNDYLARRDAVMDGADIRLRSASRSALSIPTRHILYSSEHKETDENAR